MACFFPNLVTKDLNGNVVFRGSYEICYPVFHEHTDLSCIRVPCGQCIGCRISKSREWALRCCIEASLYENNYFLTLTYDDYYLSELDRVIVPKVDFNTGELLELYDTTALNDNHLTKFMKDLRAYFKYHYEVDNIRFLASGEYGDKSGRPHFHILLFNCNIPDLKLYKVVNGYKYYNSDIINNIWKRGYVVIGDLTFESSAYVSRYTLKKLGTQDKDFYKSFDVKSPFIRMSRNPGIARDYYENNKYIIYDNDELIFPGKDKIAFKFRPPKYYDKLFAVEEPFYFENIKEDRQLKADNLLNLKLHNTSLSEREYNEKCFNSLKEKLKKLPRNLN